MAPFKEESSQFFKEESSQWILTKFSGILEPV